MVGMFVTPIPIRVKIDPTKTALEIARGLAADQALWTVNSFVALEQIHDELDDDASSPLFEVMVMTTNYPTKNIVGRRAGDLEVVGFEGTLTTAMPLTFAASDAGGLNFKLVYDPDRFTHSHATALSETAANVISCLAANVETPLQDVLDALPTIDEMLVRGSEVSEPDPVTAATALASTPTELVLIGIWRKILGLTVDCRRR